MKAFLIGALLLVGFVAIGTTAEAQQFKLGIVNVETLVQQMPEFKKIDEQVQVLRQRYEDTLKLYQAELTKIQEEYSKQQAMMTAEAKQQAEAKFSQLREEALRYQQLRLGPQGTLASYQNELLEPIRTRVRSVIEKVAMEEKVSAVMDANSLIYVEKKYDITFKVLDQLQRGQ